MLTAEEKTDLKAFAGQLAWVAGQTRPDMAFECCHIANIGKNPTIEDLKVLISH